MDARYWWDIVKIVMKDRNAIKILGKRPKAIESDFIANLHRNAHRHKSRRKTDRLDSCTSPVSSQLSEEVWIEEDDLAVQVKVLDGVEHPKGDLCVS